MNNRKDVCYDQYNEDAVDIYQWFTLFWTNRRTFLLVTSLSLIVGIIVSLIMPKQYTAVATILPPQVADSKFASVLGNMSGIAGEMLGSGDMMSKVYPDIAKSRNILIKVLDAPYEDGRSYREVLQGQYKFKRNIEDKLITLLKKNSIEASVYSKTSIVTISVTLCNPEIAAALANEILIQMDVFFKYQFRSVASSQRAMIEQRLVEVSDSLRIAEDQLLRFRENNRTTSLSPTLQINERRLVREVEINNAMYIELTRQLELAKISELQLKPVINVLDNAVPPINKSKPSRKAIVSIFGIVGFVSTVSYIKIYSHILQSKANTNTTEK